MDITIAAEHALRVNDRAQVAELIGLCLGTSGLLLTEQEVGAAFFSLHSGLAGELVQKLVSYRIRTAFVCADPAAHGPRFAELALEHSAHPQVRFFRERAPALAWLQAAADVA